MAGAQPLAGEDLAALAGQVEGWEVVDAHHIAKTWKFKNFAQALDFVNKVGEVAEQQGHHPLIHFTWGKVTIETWTHKIDGLTESDFILAARIDEIGPEV